MPVRECSVGMVTGPHPRTAEAGLEILQAGGNAFDAAVAAAFTEAVVEPGHNGVAGYGGAAVGYLASDGQVVCVDYNTQAPAAATETMFATEPCEETGYRVPGGPHRRGALSIGIPGVVAGLEEIHRSWGTLALRQVMAPAIRAARDGFVWNRLTANNFREHLHEIQAYPDTVRLLMPEGRPPEAGEIVYNRELADTLEALSVVGLRDFYEGETAVRIIRSLRRQGGILTLEDLAGYQARHVAPTVTDYRGLTLHTPPVGCGGVTSFQMLQVLEGFDLSQREPGTPAFFHLFVEVMKACWQRRLATLGEASFTGVPEIGQLDPALIAELRQEVQDNLRSPKPRPRIAADPFLCTSHLCAADRAGNVVSLTQTHGGSFGSYVTVPGTGLLFGHGMARFDAAPGRPNSIAPGKRPMHNMAPILATRDGHPAAAYGTPGGRTIVNNQAYFSLCLWALGLDVETALTLPRVHCEETEPVKLEKRAGDSVLAWLRSLGHQVEEVEKNGGPASGIVLHGSPAALDGAVDPRGDGKVAWA